MLIASSGVLHFFKAPDTNSIYLTHRPDRADQNCPAFFYTSHYQVLQRVLQRRKKVPLRWRKKDSRSQQYKALAAKQSPGLFLPNASHLEPRVASSNLANKQKRKQDIPAAPPAERSNRAQRYKALAAKQSPGLFLPNATHLEPRVASSNLANKQKRKQDIRKDVLLLFGRGDKI